MKTPHVIMLTLIAATIAAGVPAVGRDSHPQAQPPAGGKLGTLPHGSYQCALPGDAGSDAYVVVEEEGFRISTASRYANADGSGLYILRGREMTFTSGPRKGEKFQRIGDNQLRKIGADGKAGELLCTRLGSR